MCFALPAAFLSLLVCATSSRGGDPAVLTERANAAISAASLRSFHDTLASESHVAGTAGDRRTIERLAAAFASMGLEVEIHRFRPYLARPVSASLEIVGDPLPLDLRERELPEDPHDDPAHLDDDEAPWSLGWNAFSGSGTVEGEVVYANYATKGDFERLAAWGVEVRGRIVVARYGANYRGFKAKFAEEAGAIGLVLYTDPADAGAARGPVWPEGGWANGSYIQRGSLATTAAPGDALTPGYEAREDAARLEPGQVRLPSIPVQPIGADAAARILSAMTGREVPEAAWRGAIDQPYRLEGGPALRLRLSVEQERFLGESANVIATLRGVTRPEESIVVGCHHDAWGCGASDPLAGMIVLLESARTLAEAARSGARPGRSIRFAAWGAEEYGIIGSTEWVEKHREELVAGTVAYVNLDMAAMGDRLHASAAPSLRRALCAAASRAVDPFTDEPALAAWSRRGGDTGPAIGDLGGGSDHVAFWCHLGIPSCALGAGGAEGVSYHSNYDTLHWYRTVVGDDYRSARLVTAVTNALLAELADAPVLPDAPDELLADALRHIGALRGRASAERAEALGAIEARFDALWPLAERATAIAALVRSGETPDRRGAVDAMLRALRDAWVVAEGLPGRPWFRNLFAATDPTSGYAVTMLPMLAETLEGDAAHFAAAVERHEAVADAMKVALRDLVGE
jgi:N-acetylated-alpha-linked acidic dipeptidase